MTGLFFKKLGLFSLALLVFCLMLLGMHYYLHAQFFNTDLRIPIWSIYLFNAALVFIVFTALAYRFAIGKKEFFGWFMGATLIKMLLSVVFLLPVLINPPDTATQEVLNFFIPYFLFLAFELVCITQFLKAE